MATHTTAEWFEMYEEITLEALEGVLTRHNDAKKHPGDEEKQRFKLTFDPDMEAWRKARHAFTQSLKRVRADFIAVGLDLSERITLEGPQLIESPQNGLQMAYWPPRMEPWVKFFWPNGDGIELTGKDAETACAFIQWWVPFQEQMLQSKIKTPEKRLLQPGDPEFEAYFKAKEADKKHEN